MTSPDRIWCQNNTSGHMDDLLELAVRPHAEVINTAFTEYVRADIVAELVQALAAAVDYFDHHGITGGSIPTTRAALAKLQEAT